MAALSASVWAHPRSRGENQREPIGPLAAAGSSPLTRGKRPHGHDLQPRRRLIPAHAGKTWPVICSHRAIAAHPRSRGENFPFGLGLFVADGSSPLTRGKHRHFEIERRDLGLIPAHAGKTQAAHPRSPLTSAHPRSRGENSRPGKLIGLGRGSSPLTRGKRRGNRSRDVTLRLIPAHAGKTQFARPHLRDADGSSPLTRGKPLSVIRIAALPRLIPAHAGKTMCRRASSVVTSAHPRSRGENMTPESDARPNRGSSPLTRGKQASALRMSETARLIPAHAGKTRAPTAQTRTQTAHPRSRGENPTSIPLYLRLAGSSPLTRGKPTCRPVASSREGLIPAHAGKTALSSQFVLGKGAHPRSRGENVLTAQYSPPTGGSSPLTRGKPTPPARVPPQCRLIPAHAGKTYTRSASLLKKAAHPRSRGENHHERVRSRELKGSSPLTRGKLDRGGANLGSHRLIPAHAGKTSTAHARIAAWAAHPRSRGENDRARGRRFCPPGSSPLTRGKRQGLGDLAGVDGLIPAHAGKTTAPEDGGFAHPAHPRSRGENARDSAILPGSMGSSPLTRGKLHSVLSSS